MPIEDLADYPAVLAATGGDPYARGSLRRSPRGVVGWALGGAVGWLGTDQEERVAYFSVLGPPPAAAALLTTVADGLPAAPRVTVPRDTPALLAPPLSMPAYDDWDFRWTAVPPPTQPLEGTVGWADDGVAELLAVASTTASARPGDPGVRRWAGIALDAGRAGRPDACAADTSGTPGVGHVSSVATRPECRGRGLAAAVCAWLVRRLLEENAIVTLGHYRDNQAGRRLYDRLGLAHDHAFSSGRLVRS